MAFHHGRGAMLGTPLRGILHVEPSATRTHGWALRREYAARPIKVVRTRDDAIALGVALALRKDWALVLHDAEGVTIARYETRGDIQRYTAHAAAAGV